MPYHFIPNTNHDLVVIEEGFVNYDGVYEFEPCRYPIIGWRVEVHPDDGAVTGIVPAALGWVEPEHLDSEEWGVLDKRQGIVFNDGGLWSHRFAVWKANREKAFAERQSTQNASEPTP